MSPAEDPTLSRTPMPRGLEMEDQLQASDLEFFDAAFPVDPSSSPANILDENILSTPSAPDLLTALYPSGLSAGIDKVAADRAIQPSPLMKADRLQPLSNPSSVSPPSSSQASSSDSSRLHHRKGSSNSSQSGVGMADLTMMDSEMSEWKADDLMMGGEGPTFGGFSSSTDPAAMDTDYEISNKAMEHHFDFDSAASSPSPNDAETTSRSASTIVPQATKPSFKDQCLPNNNPPSDHNVQRSDAQASFADFSNQVSREVSPLSAMMTSHEGSPAGFRMYSSQSPPSGGGLVAGQMHNGSATQPGWPPGLGMAQGEYPLTSSSGNTPSPYKVGNVAPVLPGQPPMDQGPRATLALLPIPLKSRVETQIPIRMALYPVPPGVTKLHLPTHSISKPKLLAKPSPAESPEMLELSAIVVCTSAMQDPEKMRRAFNRAASAPSPKKEDGRRSSSGDLEGDAPEDENSEDHPLNGGDVNICFGCITRERKRAARKKVKKFEEEESWHKDEQRRIVVFNTHEVKEWQKPPQNHPNDELHGSFPGSFSDNAMQIDAPMRIACYCRHQNEKMGFRVIFTLKDHNGHVVAQGMTSSIMITDDHKAHAPPNSIIPQSTKQEELFANGPGMFPSGPGSFVHPSNPGATTARTPFRTSHSSSDLQGLQLNYNSPYPTAPPFFSPTESRNTSATMTPRNLSRQVSPSAPSGHTAKKRKSSGAGKVPSTLAMTRLENTNGMPARMIGTSTPTSTNASPALSPFTPSYQQFMPGMEYSHHAPAPPTAPHFAPAPTTPNTNDNGTFHFAQRSHSLENLPMQMFSAPPSAHASRAPSPNGTRPLSLHFQQQQISQPLVNGIFSAQPATSPPRQPIIHKLIPNEGPKAGGVEVTCLGNGFSQGLEVMFGNTLATTTTYWGDTSLVCLLPPAVQAGTVIVRFKHEHPLQQQSMQRHNPQSQHFAGPPMAHQQVFFKYIDDDEQELLKMALSVLGHKMTGRIEDVRDIARRIVGTGSSGWGPPVSSAPPSGMQHRQIAGDSFGVLGTDNLEGTLLKLLDFIDLDESTNQPRLNLRRPSGQTMLHLACSLGMQRFVAALLARGANPDPRDRGGFTPMHFAALHDQPQIVRRLILNGADPTMRSLQGYTPADLATSEAALNSTRRLEHHSRTRSGPSGMSIRKAESAGSLKSLWDPSIRPISYPETEGYSSDEAQGDDVDEPPLFAHSRSRRNSANLQPVSLADDRLTSLHQQRQPAPGSAAASMAALRDQFSAQLQYFQQNMHWNLPNLPNIPQIPTFPPMPNLPDYQAHPMVRRLGSLVPYRAPSNAGVEPDNKIRWWELFSNSAPAAPPPAYEDIYPQSADGGIEDKGTIRRKMFSSERAQPTSTESSRPCHTRLSADSLTEQSEPTQDNAVTPPTRHVKRVRSDRNLFFIWIPLLVVVMFATLRTRVPDLWRSVSAAHEFREHGGGHRVHATAAVQ